MTLPLISPSSGGGAHNARPLASASSAESSNVTFVVDDSFFVERVTLRSRRLLLCMRISSELR
jgi:hypothetical protein